jgi:hypothetical protein
VLDGELDFKLPPMQMIVETESLSNSAPDTVAGIALVFFEPQLISPIGLARSSYGRNIKMLELFLLPVLAFLREVPCVIPVSDLEVTSNVLKLLRAFKSEPSFG